VRRPIRLALVPVLGLAAGCALKGDVRRVELQVASVRADLARADSARIAQRDSMLAVIAALQAALTAQQSFLVQMRGDLRTELLNVQQQLASVAELTGMSQQRLTELRTRIMEQQQQLGAPPAAAPAGGAAPGPPVGPSGNPAGPGPEQMYDVSLQQYNRGSWATARLGFREFLRVYPTHERAPDALYYVGETFAREAPDSAAAVYEQVVKQFPNSPRAPSALYKLGLLAEQRGDKAGARRYYARVTAGYPRSEEANLARDRLQRLGR
jgi:tol-pal system protein YbgF